jgi:hypothetical protein
MMDSDYDFVVKRTRTYAELLKEKENLIKKLEPVKYEKRKPYEELSSQEKKRFINELNEILNEEAQVLCKSAGIQIYQVRLREKNTVKENDYSNDMMITMLDENCVKQCMDWKEKNHISDKLYQAAISYVGMKLPPLKQKRAKKQASTEK